MKDCKIYVNGKSEAIQEKLFELGCRWMIHGKKISNIESPFLYINSCELTYGTDMCLFNIRELPEITAEEILNMKVEHEFKPFDRVIVSDNFDDVWRIDIYSHKEKDDDYQYVCIGNCYTHCIPYEGNEHLLGTTNNQ